jgi:DNA segregation ATPase FtsK/SpoIIIE-like protein
MHPSAHPEHLQQGIFDRFLLGDSLLWVKQTLQLPANTIDTFLQNHFRHSASTCGTGWTKGEHDKTSYLADGFLLSIAESTEKLTDAQREINELQVIIQTTSEGLVACSDQLRDAQRELEGQSAITESKDELLLDLRKSHTIEELRKHYSGSVTERDSMTGELMEDKTRIGNEISQQKAQIRILKEALNSIDFAHEHGGRRALRERNATKLTAETVRRSNESPREQPQRKASSPHVLPSPPSVKHVLHRRIATRRTIPSPTIPDCSAEFPAAECD